MTNAARRLPQNKNVGVAVNLVLIKFLLPKIIDREIKFHSPSVEQRKKQKVTQISGLIMLLITNFDWRYSTLNLKLSKFAFIIV